MLYRGGCGRQEGDCPAVRTKALGAGAAGCPALSPLKGQYLRHLLELCGLEGEVPDVILFFPRWFSLVAKTLNWRS